MNKKLIWFMMATVSIVFLMCLIHESGHIIFCLLSGGKVLGGGYKESSIVIGILYVQVQTPNQTARAISTIGGSLFECIIALIICKIIWKTEKGVVFFFGCGFSFVSQCLYWGISPLIKFGDAYNFAVATNTNLILISIIGFIGAGISVIVVFFYWFELADKTEFFEIK